MKRIITLFFVLFVLSANAAVVTNVQRLSLFGVTNYLSPTGLVAVAPFFSGADHLKGMPADSFLRTAGSNVLLEITNFVKAQDTVVSNGVVALVISTSNSLFNVSVLVSNGVINQLIVLSNNLSSVGFARLEVQTNSVRLGLVTNLNWTYGMTGSVSSATAILGVDDSAANNAISNSLFTLINVASNFLSTSSIDVKTNQTMMVLQGTPIAGSQWYVGTNGTPITNQARSGLEFNAFWRSLRMGEVDNGPDFLNYEPAGSNYWNNTNIGVCSVGLGSNSLARGNYSSVLGGVYNIIRSNAVASVIGGGIMNFVDTNAGTAVIAGGGRNVIRVPGLSAGTANAVTISGGTNNVIGGTSIDVHGSTIGGGGDNVIEGGQHATISGGFANEMQEACDFGFIGGGLRNAILANGATAGGGNYSVVVGGSDNRSRGQYGFIGGGRENTFLGNSSGVGADYNVICGGASNNIGVNNFPSTFCFVGGGHECDIQNDAHYSFIGGGALNNIGGNSTNGVIAGGRFNTIGSNTKFASILGGERNTVNANYGVAIGTSNTTSAVGGIAIGTGLTVNDAGMVKVGNLSSYTTSQTISGAGSGSTNYTLQSIYSKMNLGSSNVNIVAVMQTTAGQSQRWRVAITNDSPDTWGFSASSTTNRWFWQGTYGTNQPSVLTNNTRLVIDGESEGTNTWATYNYFNPAK
jgi:hypothetical protein